MKFCELKKGTVFRLKSPLYDSCILQKTVNAYEHRRLNARKFKSTVYSEVKINHNWTVLDLDWQAIEKAFHTPCLKKDNELIHFLTLDYFDLKNPLHKAFGIKSTKLLNWILMK